MGGTLRARVSNKLLTTAKLQRKSTSTRERLGFRLRDKNSIGSREIKKKEKERIRDFSF